MTDTTPPTPPPSLGSRVVSGVAWKAASQITLQISRVVVALALARLLSPDDWGLAAMVVVFSGFVVVFTDNALGTALIQRSELFPGDRSTVYWINAAIGLLLATAGIALSGPAASFYGEPSVRPLFIAASIGFLISALGATQMAILARDMQFRRLELRQIAATLVGAVTGLTVAFGGFGAWAIVGQQLAEAATSTALLWFITPWRPALRFSTASLRRLGGFAGNVFSQNLLFQSGRTLGGVLIGRVLGAASLGTYALASNIILVPFSRIAAPLQQVFFPAFSRVQDDRARLADIWLRATRLVAAISMPALVGLCIVADQFVEVVLGPKWSDAAPVIQVLAGVGIVQSLQTLSAEVLLAVNRSGTLLRYTMLWFVGVVAALAIGLQWGILGVATCYLVLALLIEPLLTYVAARAVGISFMRFLGALFGVAQATVLMAVALLLLRAALAAAGAPDLAALVLLVVVGTVVYVAACVWRAPEVTEEVRAVLRRRQRRTPVRVAARASFGASSDDS
jgi:O-antigen/teichoic acid export membrane protein